jgi:prepilin-type N-terminal cleavage/methylation domain-containing protein
MKSKKKVFIKLGFTIIELLTVMSIIVILISLLVPSLNAVRRYAKDLRQRGQFLDISIGLEMFRNDDPDEEFPDSGYQDFANPKQQYCGAMKLCEAMLGQDGLGFNPESAFRIDGLDQTGLSVVYPRTGIVNRRDRELYLDIDKYKTFSLADLYTSGDNYFVGEDSNDVRLLSDIFYKHEGQRTGERLGMPVLYYKADSSKLDNYFTDGNPTPPAPYDPNNTYDYLDNWYLMALQVPGQVMEHPLYNLSPASGLPGHELFYRKIHNKKITAVKKAYNEDSYILISAGFDGLYGTRDDIYNFTE